MPKKVKGSSPFGSKRKKPKRRTKAVRSSKSTPKKKAYKY